MRWHEHESYLCSDSPPVSSGSLLDFQRRRSRGHDPGVLLAPPTPSPLRKEMVPQSRLLAPVLFHLAEYPCSTERNSSWKISRKRPMILEQRKDTST